MKKLKELQMILDFCKKEYGSKQIMLDYRYFFITMKKKVYHDIHNHGKIFKEMIKSDNVCSKEVLIKNDWTLSQIDKIDRNGFQVYFNNEYHPNNDEVFIIGRIDKINSIHI